MNSMVLGDKTGHAELVAISVIGLRGDEESMHHFVRKD